jgi:glycine oxidase
MPARTTPAEEFVPDQIPRERAEQPFDAIVVGAGLIGLTCAWRAAAAGLRVCVLDRERPGAGASGVAAGMLAPVGELDFGQERPLTLNLEASRLFPGFVADLERASGVDVGYRTCGALHVALDRDEVEELRRRHELHQRLGLASEWLTPSRCRELEPGLSTACAGGVLAAEDASVDPRRLITALRTALARAGAELIGEAEVDGALIEDGRLAGVRVAGGQQLRASWTVLAAGAWSAAEWLPSEARPDIRPVKGQILRLRSGGDGPLPCSRIVVGERVYLVPREDGELVVGATVEERGFDVAVTAGGVHELLREAYRTLPDVAELELVEASAGLRPATPDNLPVIGPGQLDGLLLASGHFRNGVLLAPLTAERIVAAMGEPAARATAPVAGGVGG